MQVPRGASGKGAHFSSFAVGSGTFFCILFSALEGYIYRHNEGSRTLGVTIPVFLISGVGDRAAGVFGACTVPGFYQGKWGWASLDSRAWVSVLLSRPLDETSSALALNLLVIFESSGRCDPGRPQGLSLRYEQLEV